MCSTMEAKAGRETWCGYPRERWRLPRERMEGNGTNDDGARDDSLLCLGKGGEGAIIIVGQTGPMGVGSRQGKGMQEV